MGSKFCLADASRASWRLYEHVFGRHSCCPLRICFLLSQIVRLPALIPMFISFAFVASELARSVISRSHWGVFPRALVDGGRRQSTGNLFGMLVVYL